jgi:hypothetical protein
MLRMNPFLMNPSPAVILPTLAYCYFFRLYCTFYVAIATLVPPPASHACVFGWDRDLHSKDFFLGSINYINATNYPCESTKNLHV